MTLTRRWRMVLEALAPPFLGSSFGLLSGIVMGLAQGTSLQFLWLQRWDYFVTFFWAYLLGGLPSLGYMFFMEACFARGLDPRSWRSVGLSTLLGTGAGLVISALLLPMKMGASLYFIGLGGAVGFVLGYLIKRLSPLAILETKT